MFWFVYREDGAFITVDEVEMAIRGLGNASVEVAPSTLARKFDRGYGIKVQFEQWDEHRDLSRVSITLHALQSHQHVSFLFGIRSFPATNED